MAHLKKWMTFCIVAAFTACVFAAREKSVVYVEKFIPVSGSNCTILPNELQVLQDRILGNVVSSRKYEVVERENLAKVQAELKLVDAGMTEGRAPESNRLKAAGYVIYGKVIQYRNYVSTAGIGDVSVQWHHGTVELQIRIANITTGRILCAKTILKEEKTNLAVTTETATSRDTTLDVMTKAVEAAAKEVVVVLNSVAFPVYVVDADAHFVVGNVAEELVTAGDLWEVWMRGRAIKDPETDEVLGYKEKCICSVRVSRPGPKLTKFEYVNASDAQDVESLLEADKKLELRKAPKSMSTAAPSRARLRAFGDD